MNTKKREFYCKGMLTSSGEWIEGFLLCFDNSYFIINHKKDFENIYQFEVVESSIGRYTGCKDVLGNRIYVNDIITIRDTNKVAIVQFKPPYFEACHDDCDDLLGYKEKCIVVVGNIFY